jgi:hypothetical protein
MVEQGPAFATGPSRFDGAARKKRAAREIEEFHGFSQKKHALTACQPQARRWREGFVMPGTQGGISNRPVGAAGHVLHVAAGLSDIPVAAGPLNSSGIPA